MKNKWYIDKQNKCCDKEKANRPHLSAWYIEAASKFYDDQIALADRYSKDSDPPWGRKYWQEWEKYMLAEKEKANR